MEKIFKKLFIKTDNKLVLNSNDSFSSRRKTIIIEGLLDKAMYKTNLIFTHYGEESNDSNQETQQFFKFNHALYISKIIDYHCILIVDDEHNGETVYIIVESIAIEELIKIASDCDVILEHIENKDEKHKILSSPYTGIMEPQGKRILTDLKELEETIV